MKNKMYIAGCGGMLGDAFYNYYKNKFKLKCSDINFKINKWLDYLDFNDFKNYYNTVNLFKPDVLVHLGALTDLEFCEANPKLTYLTNYTSVENATYIANDLNIPLVFISTAGIFDGKKTEYDDWDIPNPLCHYARSKYAAELFVSKYAKKAIVCRAGWMMGGGLKKDKKFVNKIISQIKAKNKILNIVNDKMGTPTYTYDFANNTELLINSEYWGTYNLVCEGLTSRLEVTREILKFFKLEEKVKIIEVSSDFFKKEYFVNRPDSERLINFKLNSRSLNIMRDWKICLHEYLAKEYSDYLS